MPKDAVVSSIEYEVRSLTDLVGFMKMAVITDEPIVVILVSYSMIGSIT